MESAHHRSERYLAAGNRIRSIMRKRHAHLNDVAGTWVMYETELADLADTCELIAWGRAESSPDLDNKIRAALALPTVGF